MNEYRIEYLPLEALRPWRNNARTHTESQVRQIARSIREFGWTNPILIDIAGTIIAGHGRVMAAKLMGINTVPCLRLDHLDDEQRRAYVLADNQLATLAGWDDELLRAELMELKDVGFDLDTVGFDQAALDRLFDGLEADGEGAEEGPAKDNGCELLIVSTDAAKISEIKRLIGVPDKTNRVSAHDVLRIVRPDNW